MREFVVFYSWQSDTPRRVGRDFIRKALEQAADALNQAGLEVCVRIDAGTEGVPGTPPVTDTILEKIRDCDLFIGDVTLVGEVRSEVGVIAKRIPNPNVMAEFGYAIQAKGLRRILLVMNAAFGSFDDLPFDMRHLRKPAEFCAAAAIPDRDRRAAREALAGQLMNYIKTAITAALATPSPDQALHERARTRLGDLLSTASISGAPALVNFPRAMLHISPLAVRETPIGIARATAARPFLLPENGAAHLLGADHIEWWSHAPTRLLRPHTNPVAPWCVRLFADGAIEASWNLGQREDDDPDILADGCKLESQAVTWTGRLLRALRALEFDNGAIAQLSLLGIEDVVLMGKSSVTRRFRAQSLGFPPIVLAAEPEDIALSFQHAFERMWLAAGHEHGSPC